MGGGTFEQLLNVTECAPAAVTFFQNAPDGSFLVWVPGSQVAAVNAAIMRAFPGDSIPTGTIFIAGCRPTTIVLGGEITGRGASSGDSGVTITVPGTYEVSGALADGMIEVNAPGGPVELVLAGVDLANLDGPAIHVGAATEAVLTLKDGTSNRLTDGGTSDLDAAVYATVPVTIRGGGSLTVNANYEGISSTASILVEGGHIRVLANEDGLNASTDGTGHIGVSGGHLYVQSVHGDGIDSNGTLTFDGGMVVSLGSLEDLSGGFDADGPVTINGGTVIAVGAHMPAPAPSSPQRAILALFAGPQPADQIVSIQSGGVPLLTFAPAIRYDRVFFSSSSVVDGALYDVYLGGTASGQVVDGVYHDATTYSGGVPVLTVTTDSTRY